jgi:hypothetical protein
MPMFRKGQDNSTGSCVSENGAPLAKPCDAGRSFAPRDRDAYRISKLTLTTAVTSLIRLEVSLIP